MNTILAALVNGAILSVLMTTGLWLALLLAPRRVLNAATRYVLWWAMLGIAIALPLLYVPIPRSPRISPAVREFAHKPAEIPGPQPVQPAPVRRTEPANPTVHPPAHEPAARVDRTPALSPPPSFAWPSFPIEVTAAGWARWLLAAWFCGSLFLLVRLTVSCVMLDRLRARAIDAPMALRALDALGATRRRIRIASSAEIAIPVAVGPRRPSILIPARLFAEMEGDELDQIALHEAAHLARRDDYALLAQRILEALFAWHPVVWWIVRRIDLEREIACDDFVIAATGRPRSYATCLTRVVELSGGVRSSLAAATAARR